MDTKNIEVVGVSEALKSLATKKISSMSSTQSINPPLIKQNQVVDDSIMDNKMTINPSSSTLEMDCSEKRNISDPTPTCGWFGFHPQFIQRFMTPKWALIFLCLAGTTQGTNFCAFMQFFNTFQFS
jgi:hypothetical protein